MKNIWKNILYTFLIFLFLASFFSLFNPPQKVEEVTLGELVQQIENGQVKKIEVQGTQINIELDDGAKEIATKEIGTPLEEILVNGYGLDPTLLRSVSIVPQAESSDIWLWVLLSILPIILIGFYFGGC